MTTNAAQQPPRPSWPQVWMEFAYNVARRSHDPRLHVGAVIVSEDNTSVLALGYNGNAKGLPNEVESLEPGQSGCIHAEQNALIKLDYNFHKKKHMYLTHSCCRMCAKLCINAGVSRVVYDQLYRDPSGLDLLRAGGVEVLQFNNAILMPQ